MICHFLKRRYGLEYIPEKETLITVGGSEAIDLAFRAMLNPGEEVIVPQPCYVSYDPCVTLAGGVTVTIELKEENDDYYDKLVNVELRLLPPFTQTIFLRCFINHCLYWGSYYHLSEKIINKLIVQYKASPIVSTIYIII